MQIDNIQTYNNSNQNFKALRFRRGAEKYVSTLPDKILKKLDNIDKDLSDTKFYHLDIASDCFFINHTSGERMYLPINITNLGKELMIKARQGLSQIVHRLKYNDREKVKSIEKQIKQAPTQIERTAEIVKALDNYEKLLVNR